MPLNKALLHITLFFTFFLLINVLSSAQAFRVRNFSKLEEVGPSQISKILEDHQHYLWMGTLGNGLLRFDGSRFTSFRQSSGLLSNKVYALEEDIAGDLWIGTDQGLCRFDGTHFDTLSLKEGRTVIVNDLAETKEGLLWIATNQGLFAYQHGQLFDWITNDTFPKDLAIRACLLDKNDALWLATSQGAYRINKVSDGSYESTYFNESNGLNSTDIRAITADKKGHIWLATYQSGINIYDGDQLYRFKGSDEVEEGGGINTIFCDKQGWIWIGLENKGAMIWKPETENFHSLQNTDGLESNDVRCIFQDDWANYWIGTAGGGLSRCRLAAAQFAFVKSIPESVSAIARDTGSMFWLASKEGIWRYDPKEALLIRPSTPFPKLRVNKLLQTADGRLYLATEDQGIIIYDGTRFQYLGATSGLGSNRIRDLMMDPTGQLWAATYGAGLCRIRRNQMDSLSSSFNFHHFDRQNALPEFLECMHKDDRGRLWLGAADGSLSLMEGGSLIKRWTEADGMSKDGIIALAQDTLGYLWGCTKGSGIFYLNWDSETPTINWLSRRDGLTSDHLNMLFFDQSGLLWLGHASGLDRIELDEQRQIKAIRFLGYQEGFPARPNRQAFLLDEKEGFWLGSTKGLCHYEPYYRSSTKHQALLHFTEIRISGKALPESTFTATSNGDPLELTYTENDVFFAFLAIDHLQPNSISYEWKLKGYLDDWSAIQGLRQANFADLPPGDYHFLVRAYTDKSELSKPELSFPFRIRAPFWHQIWFKSMMYALAALLLFALLYARERRIQRKASEAQEQLRVEKQLLQLEQKALQLQMNPHFIFNCLNSIQGHISQQDHKTARYQLAKFSKLMRQILESSRESDIHLADEIQLLDNYLALERFSHDNSFDYEISVDPKLDPESILLPPMLVQPFVENAIIHGITQKEGGEAMVKLNFGFRGRLLEIQVEDNGIGREAARAQKSQQSQQHKSLALQVTRERLDILNPSLGKSLEIEDLKSPAGETLGTRVWIRIPLSEE